MKNLDSILSLLKAKKVVPVIALEKAENILPLGELLIANDLPIAEITLRSPQSLEAIRLLRQHSPDILIGAGTVLSVEQMIEAKAAGADFIVTPGFNPEVVKACLAEKIPVIPGVNSTMAIEAVLAMGLTAVKFFPAEASGGVKMIKALTAPYSMLQIMPTGGINEENLKDYLAVPQIVACGGSWFVDKKAIEAHDWQSINQQLQTLQKLINN